MLKLLVFISTNITFNNSLDKFSICRTNNIFLCKSLISFSFFTNSTCFTTHKLMLSKTPKLAKKNDTQPKLGRRGNIAPFPSKTPFQQQEFKNIPYVRI